MRGILAGASALLLLACASQTAQPAPPAPSENTEIRKPRRLATDEEVRQLRRLCLLHKKSTHRDALVAGLQTSLPDLTLLTADDGLLCLEADAVLSYLPEIPGGFVQLRSGDHATIVEQLGSPAEFVSALAARIRASRAVTLRQERGAPSDLTGITEICVSYSAGLDVAKAIADKLQAALPSAVLVYAADCKHVKIIVWYSGQHQSGSAVRIEGGVARTIVETEGDAGKLITAIVEAYRIANRGKD